jgi:hypothetical protein
MKRAARLAILAILLELAVAHSFAAGAGGLLFGLAEPSWNPSFMPSIPDSFKGLEYFGGYGYGVDSSDRISGGFGLAFLDYESMDAANRGSAGSVPGYFVGGAGGLIVGSRLIGGRALHLDLAARLGLGGVGVSTRTGSAGTWSYSDTGYAIAYAEPYAELGLGLSPWMQVSATLGYPFIGNLAPGKPFADFVYWAPTFGVTVTFGSF